MRRRGRSSVVVLGVVLAAALIASCTSGDDDESAEGAGGGGAGEALATLDVIDERIDVRTEGDDDFSQGTTGMGLGVGDQVRSNSTGFGELGYFDGSWMRIEAEATLTIDELEDVEDGEVVETSIDGGRLWVRAERLTGSGGRFEVDTPVATASVRGTRFSIDCTVSWEDALEDATDVVGGEDEPDIVCSFTVIDGVVTVELPDGTEYELTAAQQLVVADDDREPIGPIQLVPDELYSDPWVQKNLGVDLDKPDADELLEGEAQANVGAATLARDWEAEVVVRTSSDPRQTVGATDIGRWQISVDCDGASGCRSERVVVDAAGAPAIRDRSGAPVVDTIEALGDGRYRISAEWSDTCERDGEVLSPEGTTVRRVGTYEVEDLEFTDGRWVATGLEGEVSTTTTLTAAGRAAGCALPNDAPSVSFSTDVVATAD